MSDSHLKQRLVAILAADAAGYSRLMAGDDRATVAALDTARAVFRRQIESNQGRVIDMAGDSVLAVFETATGAVAAALAIQQEIGASAEAVREDRRMRFRIGLHLGDVIEKADGTVYGDGVNIAARLQALAEPGGVVVSEDFHRQVRSKLKLQVGFEDMGEHEVKNIREPVRAFRARSSPDTIEAPLGLPLPNKPSIAVLPFVNMSGDPDQDYFADGLVEDIITALSKVSGLFVIARNSTFSFKGKSPDVRHVAKVLGVQNVLEGSVRRSDGRVRITAQLIEATSGSHLWAERYDRNLIDIFELQDEVTNEVVMALQVRLMEGEQVRVRRRQTNNIFAWEYYARGQSHLRRFNKQDNAMARDLLQQSIELDPDFASAWSLLAWVHYMDGRFGWSPSIVQSIERAAACVARSLERDDTQPDAHALKGTICLHQRKFDEAVHAGRAAVEMGPNVADSYLLLAHTLNYVGRAEEALRLVQQGMRLSPFFPDWYLGVAALTYRLLGRYEDSIAADKERLARNPDNIFSDFRLAATYEELGRHEQARHHVAEALRKNPQLSLKQIGVSEPYRDETDLERHIDLLRKAGLPE